MVSDYYAKCTENVSEQTDKLHDTLQSFQSAMKESKLEEMVGHYNTIFEISTALNIEPEILDTATKSLGDYIKSSGLLKRKILLDKLSKLNLGLRYILLRQFNGSLLSGFSIQSLISQPVWKFGKISEYRSLPKTPLPCPMALGLNTNGKLGIGKMDEAANELQELKLNNLTTVHIGKDHTIFRTSTGKYYGAGRSCNFLIDSKSENLSIPKELDYIKQKFEPDMPQKFMVSEDMTLFCEFRQNEDEDDDDKVNENLLIEHVDGKTKWRLLDNESVRSNEKVKIELARAKEGIVNVNGSPVEVNLEQIQWFVCGSRVHSGNGPWTQFFTENGEAWVLFQRNLYRGQVLAASREDSEDMVAVVNLEEVKSQYWIDHLAVSPDGKSFIIWPTATTPAPNKPLPKNGITPFTHHSLDETTKIYISRTLERLQLSGTLEEFIPEFRQRILQEFLGKLYEYTGLPTKNGNFMIFHLERIKQFVTIKDSGFPAALETLFTRDMKDVVDFKPILACKLDCVNVAAGWSDEERELRMSQIREKEEAYLNKLVDDIENSLRHTNNIPFKYIQKNPEKQFRNVIQLLMHACFIGWEYIQKCFPMATIFNNVFEPIQAEKNIGKAIEERMKSGDIDNNDERFKLIRVEGVVYLTEKDNSPRHTPWVVFLPIEAIKVVLPGLESFIRNNVLSLNEMYSTANDKSQFQYYMDAFFGVFSGNVFMQFDHDCKMQEVLRSDVYLIHTNDNGCVVFPKYLFQSFSAGYDGMRIREAERNGQPTDEFTLDASKECISAIAVGLMDSRNCHSLSVELLHEMLDVCRYILITVLNPILINLIALKAEDKHSKIMEELFFCHPEETINLVATYRPEIMLEWNSAPMTSNFLKIHDAVMTKIESLHYKPIKRTSNNFCDAEPPFALRTLSTDPVKIEKKWMKNFLMGDENDVETLEEFERLHNLWNSDSQSLKRKSDGSEDPVPNNLFVPFSFQFNWNFPTIR